MKTITEYINDCNFMTEGHYEDGEWKYNEIETSDNNDRDIDDYLFEYLYTHKDEHNWDYDKMKSFMKENLKDWKTEYDLKVHVSMESIDKYLQRYCNKK